MNEEAKLKIVKARIALISEQPFFGALALRLLMVEDNTQPTLWVDGKRVGYNAQFIIDTPHSQVKAAVAHEVGHCVFEHIARRGVRNPAKWNKAGDYVINAMLKDAGFDIGESWLYNPAYANMSADHIYSLLPEEPPGGGGGGGGIGQPGGALCDIRDAESQKDPSQVDEWKIAAVQAANAAKQAGKLPGALERFVHEMLNPKADWRTMLRRFVTEKSKDDYSWARPKKMMIPHGVYLPTLYSENMGTVVVVSDDSGTIGAQIQAAFTAEIQSIRDSVRPIETIFISCDARINHVQSFDQHEQFTFVSKGGGGTDFRPPFDYLEEQGIRPACLIYLTDLYGPAPDVAPDYPVLWACTTKQEAPWGELVEIEID
jgi:predicted metal-dependent peptidase